MSDIYTYDVAEFYPGIMGLCISDARRRAAEEENCFDRPADVRMWTQKWKDNRCGFEVQEGELIEGDILAPTVIVKFNHNLRYVYHNGRFAYAVKGQTSVRYYDTMHSRRLPGATDPERRYLTASGI